MNFSGVSLQPETTVLLVTSEWLHRRKRAYVDPKNSMEETTTDEYVNFRPRSYPLVKSSDTQRYENRTVAVALRLLRNPEANSTRQVLS
ncbi:hypothetical protein Q1695_012171 [Nippostrongylus brasiliensis]|nr:hypothetical protein Q1695_012171 [Nippostrongylus brasiliensis]